MRKYYCLYLFIDILTFYFIVFSFIGKIIKSKKKNLQRKKYEEINRLGEKLYDKLMEKEKKLKLLKQETTKLLNGKSMDNDISN